MVRKARASFPIVRAIVVKHWPKMTDVLKSPILYFSVAVGLLYWAGFNTLFAKPQVQSKYNAPWKIAFIFGILLIATSAALVGLAFGSIQSMSFGVIGSAMMFLSLLLHHQSIGHIIVGFGLIATIIVSLVSSHYADFPALMEQLPISEIWGSPHLSLFLFIVGVFAIGYAVSSQRMVHIFGPGTTLLSALVAIATSLVVYFDPTRLTLPTGAALVIVPIALMKTGHPSYLDNSSTSLTNKLISFSVAVASVACPALLLAQNTQPVYSGLFILCIVLGVSGWILSYFFNKRMAVLGPFYHFERRAVVFTTIAVALVAFEVAARESNSSPTLSIALMQTTMGYYAAFALSSFFLVELEPWQLPTSSAIRTALVDVLSVFVLLGVTVFVLIKYSTRTQELYTMAATIFDNFISQTAVYITAKEYLADITSPLTSSFLVASVTVALFAMTSHLRTLFTRSSLVLSPLYSNIYYHGNPRLPAAAITFNVSLTPPEPGATPSNTVCLSSLDAVLEVLRERKVTATFFLPGELVCSSEGEGTVSKIIADGHETGLLGLAGPRSTEHVVQDMERSVSAFRKIMSTIPAPVNKRDTLKENTTGEGSGEMDAEQPKSIHDVLASASNMSLTGATQYRAGHVIDTSKAMTTPSTLDQLLGPDLDMRQLRWYRPQDGSRDVRVLRTAAALGLRVSLWNACPFDWDGNLEQIQERLEKQLLIKEGLQYQRDMEALEERMRNASRDEKLEYSVSYGAINPSRVNGSIVLLHIGLPEHLTASSTWGREVSHPKDTAAVVIDTFIKAGIPTSRLLPLSRLCHSISGDLEVLKVD